MTATEKVDYQLRQVTKQLRRADMTIAERRVRRLILRRATGVKPRVLAVVACREHAHYTIHMLSNRSERHSPATRGVAVRGQKAGAQ